MAEAGPNRCLREITQARRPRIDSSHMGIPDVGFVDPTFFKEPVSVWKAKGGAADVRATFAEQGDRIRGSKRLPPHSGRSFPTLFTLSWVPPIPRNQNASMAKPTGRSSKILAKKKTGFEKNVIFLQPVRRTLKHLKGVNRRPQTFYITALPHTKRRSHLGALGLYVWLPGKVVGVSDHPFYWARSKCWREGPRRLLACRSDDARAHRPAGGDWACLARTTPRRGNAIRKNG